MNSEENTIISTKIKVHPEFIKPFIEWQAELNFIIAAFPGFVSLEILSSSNDPTKTWTLVQRFSSPENLNIWLESKERYALIEKLKRFIPQEEAIQDLKLESKSLEGIVTQIIITTVSPDKEEEYQKWIAKIHKVEAQFPGFRGMYVQSPKENKSQNWITLLQFDTVENLNRWLISSEREEVLRESKSLIASIESHRVVSPYGGWFASLAKNGHLPSVWKQTMIVLLVLFPIVMLELKYLSPITSFLNRSLATFIGNTLSVILIAWPMMPIAIGLMKWWLSPEEKNHTRVTIIGTFVMIGLYLLEIALFW